MRTALALVVALGVVGTLQAETHRATNPWARVRAVHARVEKLVGLGMDRSATFRQLVRRIEASDVIVYIEARHDLKEDVGASMRFVARSTRDRYVRVLLNARHNEPTLVALLGHELQHVVEVAEHPEVGSPDELREFYRRLGLRTGPDSFDSAAARETGYLVRAELIQHDGLRMAQAGDARERRLLDGGSIEAPGMH
jgi:hypothetical protein